MFTSKMKTVLAASVVITTISHSATAGGLSDAIVERQPIVVSEASEAGLPGWVLPVAALVVLGVVASTSGGDSDDDNEPTAAADVLDPGNLDPK